VFTCVNIYMAIEFLRLFRYFLERKVNANGGLSKFNNFIVYWVYFNFGLKELHAINFAIFLTLY